MAETPVEDPSTQAGDYRPRRRRRAVEDDTQVVFPMPQSEQPHPHFGWDAPNPYAEDN